MSETQLPPEEDLSDSLNEQRQLSYGAGLVFVFLMGAVFTAHFHTLPYWQRLEFVAVFLCSVLSMIFLLAPAAQHRVMRPLKDRKKFKRKSTLFIKLGLVTMPLSWVLATHLVVTIAWGFVEATVIAPIIGSIILYVWWIYPLMNKDEA